MEPFWVFVGGGLLDVVGGDCCGVEFEVGVLLELFVGLLFDGVLGGMLG